MKVVMHFKEKSWVSNPSRIDIEINQTEPIYEPRPIPVLLEAIRERMRQLGRWEEV